MATLKTIVDTWENLHSDVFKANMKSLKYIQVLASQAEVNVNRWAIDKIFVDPEDETKLLTDPRKINKAFFKKLQELKTTKGKVGEETFPKELVKLVKKSYVDMGTGRIRFLNQEITRVKEGIKYHVKSVKDMTRMVNQYALELEKLQSDDSNEKLMQEGVEAITKVVNNTFWTDLEVLGDSFWVRTANDIILTHRDPKAKIDQTVNLGKFMVKFNLADRYIAAYPCGGNVFGQCHSHPHVDSEGNICWGDLYTEISQKLTEGVDKIPYVFECLAALLTTYCDDSPYAHLSSFYLQGKSIEDLGFDYHIPSNPYDIKKSSIGPAKHDSGKALEEQTKEEERVRA